MNEELKKTILENEALVELLLAINLNNTSTDAEEKKIDLEEYKKGDFSKPFRDASFFDIEYNIELLRKWKNSNALDLLNNAIKENPNEATEENINEAREKYEVIAEAQRGLYEEQLDFLRKNLNYSYINKAYYVFCGTLSNNCFFFLVDLLEYFLAISKYEGTEIAEDLRGIIKDIIEEQEVNTTNLDILKENKDKVGKYTHFYFNVESGLAISELLYNASYNGIGTTTTSEKNKLKYLYEEGNILEELLEEYKNYEDAVAELLLRIKEAIYLKKLFMQTGSELLIDIEEIAKKYGIEYILEDLDIEKRDNLAINKFMDLEEVRLDKKERTKGFKNYAVKKIIGFLAQDETTKQLAEEPRKTREEIRREKYITFNDLEPVGDKWTKINTSDPHNAIMNLHKGIATYNENNIDAKERKLKGINYSINRLESKDTLTDKELDKLEDLEDKKEILEEDLEETRKRLNKIDKEIENLEEKKKTLLANVMELEEVGLSNRELRREKNKLKRELKALETTIEMKKKSKGSRGLYLQLAQDEGQLVLTSKESFKGGDITLFIDNRLDIESHFNREATTFLRYLQGQAYYLPFEKYKNEDLLIFLDLEDYLEETGRKQTAYKSVRDQLQQALDLLQKEYFKVNGRFNKYNLDLEAEGKIEIIGDYFIIQPGESRRNVVNNTKKTTFAFSLGHTYKRILFNEKVLQWASIPRLLNRLTNKEIKQKGYTNTKQEVVQDLGYFLYEDLRRNIREKKEGYYKRTYKIKTLVEQLVRSGALASNTSNTYTERIIKPLEDALDYLEAEANLITYSTKAFTIYAGDEELNEKGLAGSSEAVIKKAFEDAKITITFKVYDKETYDNILENKKEGIKKAQKKKKEKEKKAKETLEQLELITEADIIEK